MSGFVCPKCKVALTHTLLQNTDKLKCTRSMSLLTFWLHLFFLFFFVLKEVDKIIGQKSEPHNWQKNKKSDLIWWEMYTSIASIRLISSGKWRNGAHRKEERGEEVWKMCSHLCYFSSLQKKPGCEEASPAILCRYTADTQDTVHSFSQPQASSPCTKSHQQSSVFLSIFMSCFFPFRFNFLRLLHPFKGGPWSHFLSIQHLTFYFLGGVIEPRG